MKKKSTSKKKKIAEITDPKIRRCSSCGKHFKAGETYVLCTKCAGFFLCLECYSIGAEAKGHLRSHPCIAIEPQNQEIYQEGWTAEEEALLLYSIQSCGLDNWHAVSDVVLTKTPIECECHYNDTYLLSTNSPYPTQKIIPPSTLPPPPDYDTSPRESCPSIAHDKNLALLNKKEKTTPAEYAGWMPRRHEFEVEYLNDAEQLISDISFSESDETIASLEKKLKSLRIYNEQLEERHFRIDFAIDYGMLDKEFKTFGAETKTEKEMEETLIPLAQILPRDVLENFIRSCEKEVRLKEQIKNYRKWRQNGIITRDEGLLFDKLEQLLEKDKLQQSAIDQWNQEVVAQAESPEFRATIETQLLSEEETKLCRELSISPHSYLRIKTLLLSEFTVYGEMSLEKAVSFMPNHRNVISSIYECLKNQGLFVKAPGY
ncbi:Myb-like DNA-binding domain containing protein [Histomonas meleagridis]|uniref:Myb-like DNA-binding domain containing protein n=1 Tax=Histomonas meleagridis TaxID=135588 RepID=UPI00355A547F|nr:Myb-like DNA-binding domain containing protein [Histomonas meleagridis]KAH0801292.1 Myb-like DNA-binding domain containing protein [Histomonas meleagridis]